MLIYIIFIFFIFFLTFISLDKKVYRIATFLTFLVYIFFVGFRFETGFDWLGYRNEFYSLDFNNNFLDEIFSKAELYKHEPFYVFSVYVIKYFLPDFFFIIFLSSFLLYYSYKKLAITFNINVNSLLLVVLLFSLFTVSFSVIRQSIAIAFFNLAIVNWVNKKHKKLVLFLVLAFLFHFSSILYIGVFFVSIFISRIKRVDIPFKIYGIILFVGVIIPQVITFDNSTRIGKKLNYYFSHNFNGNIFEIAFNLVLYLAILLFLYVLRKKATKQLSWILHYIILSILLSLIFFSINPIRNRIFYELIILLSIYLLVHKKSMFWLKDIKLLFLYGFGSVLFIASTLKLYSIAFTPYQSYFQVWFFNDYGNGEARQEYIYFKVYKEKYLKQKAIKQNKIVEYNEMVKRLEQNANINQKK